VVGRNFDTEQFEIGRVFEGKYRIVEEIGRGGFGMIYLAHQEAMDRQVALKVLKSDLPEGDATQAKERFLREVKVIASLRHPNTVTIHDFGESSQGILYMVLEYIEGETLDDILEREGAQAPERALLFGMQIARSLAEAHRHGVVHRDLKPANIMVTQIETEGEFVKVLDFGVARLIQNEQKDLTQIGVPEGEQGVVGTPRYMSPEQVRGNEIDGRTDVYCLGLLLYEMLVGKPAVQGETPMSLITQHIDPNPLPLELLRGLPDDVARTVRTCTQKDKTNRYESAEQLVKDLRRVASRVAKNPETSASVSDSFSGSAMSYGGELITDYQDELSDLQNDSDGGRQAAPPDEDWAPELDPPSAGQQPIGDGAADGGPASEVPDEIGDVDPFSTTNPESPPADEMPDPPDDDDPFAPAGDSSERHTGQSRSDGGRAGAPTPGERAPNYWLRSTLDTFKITLLTTAAAFGVYITFLVVGALLEGFLVGQNRMFAALIIALLFPVLSAISETSDRERFRVVRRRINRVARALITTAGLSIASSALVLLAVPDRVIGEMQTNPNWFLQSDSSQSTVVSANERLSRRLARIFAGATAAIGVYNPGPGAGTSGAAPAGDGAEPPPPTRPSTADGDDEAEGDGGEQREPRSAIELLDNPPDDSDDDSSEPQKSSSDTSESSSGTEDDEQYKKW